MSKRLTHTLKSWYKPAEVVVITTLVVLKAPLNSGNFADLVLAGAFSAYLLAMIISVVRQASAVVRHPGVANG